MDNLPLQLTSFVGREQELAEVRRLLTETRLLTLTGSSGCGKTRLALQAAAGLKAQFPGGIWWVELAPVAEPARMLQTVFSALVPLGVTEQPDRTPLESLIAHLQPKQLLLILDNCEHITAICAHLAETLLRTCPALRLLVTSRESLGIGGERVWLIPSLSTPPSDNLPPLADLAGYAAVRLFVERASAVKRTFRLTEHNARAVAQICHRLDGIPLAIELAAARTPVLSVEQIASHLDNCLRLLGAGRRTLLPRHRTLRAAIDWSYDLLSSAEQVLFRRLSIFVGGFTLEAAEAICADEHEGRSGVGGEDILDLLSRLVDKSLVAVQEQDDTVRYTLLETLRQYGREKLVSCGEEVDLRARHLSWYLGLAEQSDTETFGPNRAVWMARLESEHDNLRAALEWSLASDADSTLAEQGMQLAIALGSFWYMRGHTSEGRSWLGQVLAQTGGASTVVRAQALARAGFLAWCQNDYAQATVLLEEGQALARSLGAAGQSALQMALNCLGSVAYYQDDYARATALFEEWLGLLREMGDREHLPYALSWLGRVAVRRGEYARARALAEESLLLSRQQGNVHSTAATLSLSGMVACYLGELERAAGLLEESLALSRSLSHRQDMANTLILRATVAIYQNDLQRAAEVVEESLILSRDVGYRQGIALALGRLGEVAGAQGDYSRATARLHESLSRLNALGARWHLFHDLEAMAVVLAAQGRVRQAAQLLGATEALRHTLGAVRPPVVQSTFDRTLETARKALSRASFNEAWAEGTRMDLAQAVGCALSEDQFDAQQIELRSTRLATQPQIKICGLGPVQVYRAGSLLTAAVWSYARPKELLFYLLSHPPRTREQIGLAFWPEASPAQLRTRFHDALHHLRQALGGREWVIFTDGHYTFNRELAYWYDVELFESRLEEILAERTDAGDPATVQQLEEALLLYRGDFLGEMEPRDWVLLRREELRGRYLRGLLLLGRWRFAAGHYEAAAEKYRQAILHDAYLEGAHRELMRCLVRLGAASQALRHYQTLVELLRDEIDTQPARETTALFESIRRGEVV